MNSKVLDLMKKEVLTIRPHATISHTKKMMLKNGIHTLPVIDQKKNLLGIITTEDFLKASSDGVRVKTIMTQKVYTVPPYSDIHIAARVMRNHKINHLVVTHEKKVVGILSAYDLLSLVEEHRFIMKNPPTETKKQHIRY